MKLSFFTFLRDPHKLGYPFLESIKSALPIADEFVIALAEGEDTFDAINQEVAELHSPKIRVVKTVWNEAMRTAGFVYGQQKMLAQSYCQGDYAFYLEADEVLHEGDYEVVDRALRNNLNDRRVEAFAFRYFHFFGSPGWLARSPGWYRYAPRIIRNDLRSVALDGLFWNVIVNNQKLRWPRAKVIDASIYHYGHVRSLTASQNKQDTVQKYWGKSPREISKYEIHPKFLKEFRGTHPAVMQEWLALKANKTFKVDMSYVPSARDRRHLILMMIEHIFGIDFSKKHFKILR